MRASVYNRAAATVAGSKTGWRPRAVASHAVLLTRILIRLPNWVGDILMARPALHAIRARWPDATLIGLARSGHHALLERFGLFDELLDAPVGTGLSQAATVWSAVHAVRARRPDVAVIMAPSFEAAFTSWAAVVRRRVGHATDRRRPLLTDAVAVNPDIHRIDAFRDLARALGACDAPAVPPLALTDADRIPAARLFAAMNWSARTRPLFLNPAAAKTARSWSSPRFRRVAERLTSGPRPHPIIVHARAPFAAAPEWGRAHGVALIDDFSLPELAALLQRCALYVGNDSGPAHLAAAAGLPTVTIFGPSTSVRTGPRAPSSVSGSSNTMRQWPVSADFPCAPCRERFFADCPSPPSTDGRPPCLEAVTVDMVVAQVEQALNFAAD